MAGDKGLDFRYAVDRDVERSFRKRASPLLGDVGRSRGSGARNRRPLDHEPGEETVFLPNHSRFAIPLPLENAHVGAV